MDLKHNVRGWLEHMALNHKVSGLSWLLVLIKEIIVTLVQ